MDDFENPFNGSLTDFFEDLAEASADASNDSSLFDDYEESA